MKVILILFTIIIFLIIYSFKNKQQFQNLNLIKTNIKSPYKYNLKNIKIINYYIYYPKNIYIENDESYYSIYMKDNVSIYDVIEKIKKLDLILFTKNNELIGYWNHSNLLYDYEANKIYNVDYEGFAINLYFKMLTHYFPFIHLDINNYFNMLIKKIKDTPV